jgi:hypothetical protein
MVDGWQLRKVQKTAVLLKYLHGPEAAQGGDHKSDGPGQNRDQRD